MPGATLNLHLEETILGVDVALSKKQVSLVFGEDLGYPEAVTQDLDGAAEARKLRSAFQLRQRSAQETPEERLRCAP
jgi:hypothetical protein